MSRINACGLRRPAAKVTLVGCGEGGPEVPRLAWPVLTRPSWRAECSSSSQLTRRPSVTSGVRRVARPSASKGLEARPRRMVPSSMIAISGRNRLSPMLSLRKLVPRATALPTMAPSRWPTRPPAMRFSYMTGSGPEGTLRGLRRRTARSPAVRPISAGAFRLCQCRAECQSWSRSMAVPVPAIIEAATA